MSISRGASLLLFVLLQTCAQNMPYDRTTSNGHVNIRWQSTLYTDHPLVGMIWRSSDQRFISRETLFEEIGAYDFVLLGEKHDNPDHHQLQRQVLQELHQDGVLDSVSFEMLSSDQQQWVDSLAPSTAVADTSLKEHLRWDEEGWQWEYYGPMIRDALAAGVSVAAANISSDEMTAVYRGDPDDSLGGILSELQLAQLNQDIDQSHCGMLPSSQFPAMLRVQQTRDQRMANSMMGFASSGTRALIAGNFHVRRDLGVPNYIPASAGRVVSLAFMEVDPTSANPQDYLQQFSATAPYDYVWFTPAVSVEDYCASLTSGSVQSALNESESK